MAELIPCLSAGVLLFHSWSEVLRAYRDELNQGYDAIRWIDYELDTLIPQLERIEAQDRTMVLDSTAGDFRDMLRRAEDLAGTLSKIKFQRGIISRFKTWENSRKLRRIKEKISLQRTLVLLSLSYRPVPRGPAPANPNQTAVHSTLRCYQRYLLLFPPTIPVPSRRLIAIWVAEGLVHRNEHDKKSAEQIALGILKELRHRGMVQVSEDKRTGKLICSIDPSSRAQLMDEANQFEFFKGKKGDVRRLVDHHCSPSRDDSFIEIQRKPVASESLRIYRDVISFLSFNTVEESKIGELIGDFLHRCISSGCFVWLRTLDLEGVFQPKLPDTLGRLITVRYLGLRATHLQQLPTSVEKLLNLHVLDLKHTYISILPRSIWRMQFLTHLFLTEAYRTKFPRKPSKVTLGALQTLWGAFVDEDTPVQGGLDTLCNIRKLGLSCKKSSESKPVTMGEQLEAIEQWISNLEYLETLRLKSRDEYNKAADLCLTSLKRNRKLSTVNLLGKLDSILLCRLPTSLTSITLTESGLQVDPLEFLGRLPKLTILRLLGQSVASSEMCCSKRAFLQLRFLWIWRLDKLEVFEVEQGSMPYLEELEIKRLSKIGSSSSTSAR